MVRTIRIANVNIPNQKNICVALSSIYGIGKKFFKKKSQVQQILQKLNVNPSIKTKDLSDEQISSINQLVQNLEVENDLRQTKKQNISEKIRINSLQGKFHAMGKKVRAQRTRRNNRNRPNGITTTTRKPIAVAGKKKAPQQG